MTLALVLTLLGVVGLPHVLALERTAPVLAMSLWLSAIVMRALLVAASVVALVVIAPRTAVFSAVTHWCWHTVLPLLTTHLGLDGHRVGDAAVILPAMVIAASVISVSIGVLRAARLISALVRKAAVARGPAGSLIISGPEVVVAVAGLTRPQVLVSAGALTRLDDEELAASLDHERGHIARGHRWLLLVAELARSIARFLPGTATAIREFALHVERDADRWALSRRHDPLALASAICKAASPRALVTPALSSLGGAGGLERRLDELTGAPPTRARASDGLLGFAAVASVAITLAVVAAAPGATAATVASSGAAKAPERHCAA